MRDMFTNAHGICACPAASRTPSVARAPSVARMPSVPGSAVVVADPGAGAGSGGEATQLLGADPSAPAPASAGR
jgi:hypothetical protein